MIFKPGCASLHKFIGDGRSKAEPISQTAKTALHEWYVKKYLGREKKITTPAIEKGIITEDKSIEILTILDNEFYLKNEDRFENEFVCGYPDIIGNTKVIDIKASEDILTFTAAKYDSIDPVYETQLQGYMWLLGYENAELVYILHNMPEEQLAAKIRSSNYKRGYYNPLTSKEEEEIWYFYNYDDMPIEDKVHRFTIKRDEEKIARIERKIPLCREYLKQTFKV
jgi:hypothetical protein